MNNIDKYSYAALALIIIFFVVIITYHSISGEHYDNVHYQTLLPGSSYLDINKLDRTRSERGIPITERIIL